MRHFGKSHTWPGRDGDYARLTGSLGSSQQGSWGRGDRSKRWAGIFGRRELLTLVCFEERHGMTDLGMEEQY